MLEFGREEAFEIVLDDEDAEEIRIAEAKEKKPDAGFLGVAEGGIRFSRHAAKTMAMVSMAANGMSVAAAWEKPIMPTVVGRRRRSQRAVSAP